MFRKLKNKNGSAMSIAIVSIVLVSMVGTSITMMVNNQMKLYQKNSKHTDLKYDTEKGIEEVIGQFIEEINVMGKNEQFSEIGVLQSYVELADIIVASKGNFNSAVNVVLNKIKQGIVTQQDMNILIDELGNLEMMVGKSNPDAKELIGISKEYANFFALNFFNQDGILNLSNIDINVSKLFIDTIINNLSIRSFITGNGNNTGVYYGNTGVVYRDLVTISGKGEPFKNIYKEFNNDSSINVVDKIKELTKSTESNSITTEEMNNINDILKTIESTKYTENIKQEIYNIKKGSYLDEKNIKHYYSTTGNVTYIDTVCKRLEIVKKEIDMLVQWLNLMKDKTSGGTAGGGSTSTSTLEVSIPKQVILTNEVKTITIEPIIDSADIVMTENTDSSRYVFKILSPSARTNILANLKIESKTEDYTIESDVQVNIYGIVSDADYKVEYDVKTWDKKIN